MKNPSTKFEVLTYQDTKVNAKCRNLSDFGRLWGTQGHWQRNHSVERIRLPIWL